MILSDVCRAGTDRTTADRFCKCLIISEDFDQILQNTTRN